MRMGGVPAPYLTEAFDTVTAPALPAGWTTAISGALGAWTTIATAPVNSSPNAAVGPSAAAVGNTELISPAIAVPAGGAQLSFRNLYNLERGTTSYFDGMVLEYSVNGGAFADITSGAIRSDRRIQRRHLAIVQQPPREPFGLEWPVGRHEGGAELYRHGDQSAAAAAGQMVRLKWRVATDSSVSATGPAGARIDNVTLTSLPGLRHPARA